MVYKSLTIPNVHSMYFRVEMQLLKWSHCRVGTLCIYGHIKLSFKR